MNCHFLHDRVEFLNFHPIWSILLVLGWLYVCVVHQGKLKPEEIAERQEFIETLKIEFARIYTLAKGSPAPGSAARVDPAFKVTTEQLMSGKLQSCTIIPFGGLFVLYCDNDAASTGAFLFAYANDPPWIRLGGVHDCCCAASYDVSLTVLLCS